jgi:hypothetical protein
VRVINRDVALLKGGATRPSMDVENADPLDNVFSSVARNPAKH